MPDAPATDRPATPGIVTFAIPAEDAREVVRKLGRGRLAYVAMRDGFVHVWDFTVHHEAEALKSALREALALAPEHRPAVEARYREALDASWASIGSGS